MHLLRQVKQLGAITSFHSSLIFNQIDTQIGYVYTLTAIAIDIIWQLLRRIRTQNVGVVSRNNCTEPTSTGIILI